MKKFVLAILGLVGGLSLFTADIHAAKTATLPLTVPVPVWSHDLIGAGGYLNDIEIDSAGHPHVLFVDQSTAVLRYARHDAGAWSITNLAPFPVDQPLSDLAIDLAIDPTNDEPVVAYVDTQRDNLYVGRLHGGVWWFDRVADGGRLLTLRLDDDGGAHMAYVSGQNTVYSWRTNGVWHHETIGGPWDYVWNLFLILDEAGFPHVAGTGSEGSYYAQRLGPQAWDLTSVPVDDLDNIEGLTLDSHEQPHFLVTESEILFGRPPFAKVTLSLVSRTGDQWEFTRLWQANDWYVQSQLATGPDGVPHVLYYDTESRPHYVIARSDGSLVRDRPFGGGVGQLSLAFGADGQPWIGHHDGQNMFLSRRSVVTHDHLFYGIAALAPADEDE